MLLVVLDSALKSEEYSSLIFLHYTQMKTEIENIANQDAYLSLI